MTVVVVLSGVVVSVCASSIFPVIVVPGVLIWSSFLVVRTVPGVVIPILIEVRFPIITVLSGFLIFIEWALPIR